MGSVVLINPKSAGAGFGKMHGCGAAYATRTDHNDIPYCHGIAHSVEKFVCSFGLD